MPKINWETLPQIIDSLYDIDRVSQIHHWAICYAAHFNAEWQLDVYVCPCSSLSKVRLLLVVVTLGYSKVFFVSRAACWPHKRLVDYQRRTGF